MNRRSFLVGAGGATAAGVSLLGANDTVRVACVGLRGQGSTHIGEYLKMPKVEIAAVCDVDESILARRTEEIEKASGRRPAGFTDFRRLLEDKSIDAVSIATPNHHHTLQTIWALQAGKDVYVEKPCSHDAFESRQIMAATRKYQRVVQHGANSRSSPAVQEAVRQIRDGVVGDVYMARGLCYKWRDKIGRAAPGPVPPGVHYDLWLGPAPRHDFTRNRFHYNWHWFWDYGNGDIGNQGAHQMDVARWGLGVRYPTKVSAIGGHFLFDDDQETPNTLTATFEFQEDGKTRMLVFEVRHWITNREAGIGESIKGAGSVGNVFYGSKGYLTVDGGRYSTFLGRDQQPGPSGSDGGNNWRNFIEVVRSRDTSQLYSPIDEGAISCMLIHLANISYRVGRTVGFDPKTWTIPNDPEATALLSRTYQPGFAVREQL